MTASFSIRKQFLACDHHMESNIPTPAFGLFIHWGLYAIPSVHEQLLARGDWRHEDYEALARSFNPVSYDPDEWVRLAEDAGMRYICFTAKHHDGFCLWNTKETDYNIMNTPYGKDTLYMLAEACAKRRMGLSIYYSIPDWHHPAAYNPLSSHQWKAKDPAQADMGTYIAFLKAQVKELLTGYGKIHTFFWDIPPHIEDPSVNELVRSLQPGILINDRGFDRGDFATPERTVPEGSRFPTPTEACQSVGAESWGYRADEDYFTARHLMSSIDKIMAMGGSYLLNAGPTAEGVIPEKSRTLIRRIGRWYRSVSEGLEHADPPSRPYRLRGNEPCIVTERGGASYFHFWRGLDTTAVTFMDEDLPTPSRAILCNTGAKLPLRYGTLPTLLDPDHVARRKVWSVSDIPADDIPDEPPVIRVEWK